jgi:hypothetical protein
MKLRVRTWPYRSSLLKTRALSCPCIYGRLPPYSCTSFSAFLPTACRAFEMMKRSDPQ